MIARFSCEGTHFPTHEKSIDRLVDLVSSAHIREMKAKRLSRSVDTVYVARHESNIESEAADDERTKSPRTVLPGCPSFSWSVFY